MKKQLILALAISISAFSFAQKKELKAAEKAIKSSKFSDAKSALGLAEKLMSQMDDKSKAKFYLLKAKSLFANGNSSAADKDKALEFISKLGGSDNADAEALKTSIYNQYITKANESYEKQDYSSASVLFEKLYRIRSTDTIYLYYSASTAVNVKEYDRALSLYEELKDLNYTGIQKQFFATEKETGKEVVLDKATRDLYVKAGSHVKPGERMTESKMPEIVKNRALIYIANGDNDKALAAIKDARAANPDNVDLIVNEANIYLKLKDEDKFKELIEQALLKDPENPVLHYNVGVVNMNKGDLESAQTSFEKALSLDPSSTNSALNLSNLYIEKGNVVIADMGKLGMSKADDAKYEKLKVQKNDLFQTGAKVLTDFMTKNPNPDVNILIQLKNIYSALGDALKSKEIGAKIDAMGGQ